MVAKTQIPKGYSVKQLRLLAAHFKDHARLLEESADKCEALEEETLYVFNSSSLKRGTDALQRFINELGRSLAALVAGDPIRANTRKPRSKPLLAAEEKQPYEANSKDMPKLRPDPGHDLGSS